MEQKQQNLAIEVKEEKEEKIDEDPKLKQMSKDAEIIIKDEISPSKEEDKQVQYAYDEKRYQNLSEVHQKLIA